MGVFVFFFKSNQFFYGNPAIDYVSLFLIEYFSITRAPSISFFSAGYQSRSSTLGVYTQNPSAICLAFLFTIQFLYLLAVFF